MAKSVRHYVGPNSIQSSVEAKVGSATLISKALINSVRPDTAFEFGVVDDSVINEFLKRCMTRSEGNSSRNVKPEKTDRHEQNQKRNRELIPRKSLITKTKPPNEKNAQSNNSDGYNAYAEHDGYEQQVIEPAGVDAHHEQAQANNRHRSGREVSETFHN